MPDDQNSRRTRRRPDDDQMGDDYTGGRHQEKEFGAGQSIGKGRRPLTGYRRTIRLRTTGDQPQADDGQGGSQSGFGGYGPVQAVSSNRPTAPDRQRWQHAIHR